MDRRGRRIAKVIVKPNVYLRQYPNDAYYNEYKAYELYCLCEHDNFEYMFLPVVYVLEDFNLIKSDFMNFLHHYNGRLGDHDRVEFPKKEDAENFIDFLESRLLIYELCSDSSVG